MVGVVLTLIWRTPHGLPELLALLSLEGKGNPADAQTHLGRKSEPDFGAILGNHQS